MNHHTALGIAQLIFYVPIPPIAIYLYIRNAKLRPRLAWWPMIPFSLMRLAGGPVIIAFEKSPNLGLYIAAVILLNVGAIPLIINALGFIRIVLLDNYSHNPRAGKISSLIRIAILPAIALLAAGGGVSSQGTPSSRNLSRSLTLAGYVIFAAILVVLVFMALFFWRKRFTLLPSSQIILRAPLLAAPFLVVRTVYGILQVALTSSIDPIFNPVLGNVVAFALMALLPEYLVLMLYIQAGFAIAPDRGLAAHRDQSHITEQHESPDKSHAV